MHISHTNWPSPSSLYECIAHRYRYHRDDCEWNDVSTNHVWRFYESSMTPMYTMHMRAMERERERTSYTHFHRLDTRARVSNRSISSTPASWTDVAQNIKSNKGRTASYRFTQSEVNIGPKSSHQLSSTIISAIIGLYRLSENLSHRYLRENKLYFARSKIAVAYIVYRMPERETGRMKN